MNTIKLEANNMHDVIDLAAKLPIINNELEIVAFNESENIPIMINDKVWFYLEPINKIPFNRHKEGLTHNIPNKAKTKLTFKLLWNMFKTWLNNIPETIKTKRLEAIEIKKNRFLKMEINDEQLRDEQYI